MPSRRRGRLAAASLVAGASVLLSGCVDIESQRVAQRDAIGDVDVSTTLCATTGEPTCATSQSAGTDRFQLLVAYVVPNGAEVASIRGTDVMQGASFAPSAEYAQAATSLTGPVPDGFQVVAFKASPIAQAAPSDVKGDVDVRFDVDGVDADLQYRTVAGYRWVRDATGWEADRPLACGTADYTSRTSSASCVIDTLPQRAYDDAPARSGRATRAAVGNPAYPFATLATNRLQLSAPDAASTVVAGGVTTVAFPVKSNRAGDEPVSVPVAASTKVSGATVVAPSSFSIGTNGTIDVSVAVPAATPAGEYAVEVRVGSESGLRTVERTITVTAAPKPEVPVTTTPGAPAPAPVAPEAPLTIPERLAQGAAQFAAAVGTPETGKALRGGNATLPLNFPTRGFVRVSLLGQSTAAGKKAPVIAVGTAETDKAGIKSIALRRTAQGKRILGTKKVVTGTLVIRLWGREGKTISTPVTVTLP